MEDTNPEDELSPQPIRSDEIGGKPPRFIRLLMLDVIFEWANIDQALTNWLSAAYELKSDNALLLVGAMSATSKLDKLKAFYPHRGDKAAGSAIKKLQGKLVSHIEVRNFIAHSVCLGTYSSKPDAVAFGTNKPTAGTRDMSRVVILDAENFKKAVTNAKVVFQLVQKLAEVQAEKSRVTLD